MEQIKDMVISILLSQHYKNVLFKNFLETLRTYMNFKNINKDFNMNIE